MKVLYLSSPYYADCDFPLVHTFQEKGVDITYLVLLTPSSKSSTLVDISHQLPQTRIFPATIYEEFKKYRNLLCLDKVFVANMTGKSRLSVSYWKNIWNVRHFIKKGQFDIVHYSGFNHWFYGTTPFITTFHDPFPHTGESFNHQKISYQRAIDSSRGIVILNETQLDDFLRMYSINPKRVLVNRLSVYDSIRSFVKPNMSPVKNRILYFGRISPYKGIEYLCAAMDIVHKHIPDATLLIAGNGKYYFDIEPYYNCGFIKFINRYIPMPELAGLLLSSVFTICPYTDATQSGVIMTSYSLGKPVVASAVGGICEMVEDGKTGLLVPPRDVNALANAIIVLLSDKEQRDRMSRYIYEKYFIGDRSWSSIAERYLDFYEDITNRRH